MNSQYSENSGKIFFLAQFKICLVGTKIKSDQSMIKKKKFKKI